MNDYNEVYLWAWKVSIEQLLTEIENKNPKAGEVDTAYNIFTE